MRFTTAILAALAIASIGVQALPSPEEPTRPAYQSSFPSSSSTDTYEPTKPSLPEPTDKPTPQPPKPDEPEYETVCKKFAFFHNWDYDCGDLPCGPTKAKYIYDCAEDCLQNENCDATVSFEGSCYPKTLDSFQSSKLGKKEGRDLAIQGCCEDLQANYNKTKCYPDGFLDCCYDKVICTKVYK
ncbi:hypothetical protein QFC21_004208 [Naganishia friedmannii]|uniref:Uncharacterized protein n=1 Tax=Naganishia friedmannii TaxID=89922 RepID=A0ACC2VK82_9TREE|nr:hypothetical protein QFC21_004208 [Naganishia friedmannii]